MQKLTKQESKVAQEIALGYSEKEIASRLFLSTHTVHSHSRNIRKKWNARSAVDVCRIYILNLDNPKVLLLSLFFLILQMQMVLFDAVIDEDMIRVVRTRQTRKNGRRKNENDLILC